MCIYITKQANKEANEKIWEQSDMFMRIYYMNSIPEEEKKPLAFSCH